MSVRVSPIEGIRDEIHDLFGSGRQLGDVLEDVARLSVRLVIQSVWEAEVTGFLERDRYARRDDDSPAGSRNGYQPPSTIKTTLGAVQVRRPKLRSTLVPFASQLFGAGVTRTNALESLVIAGWVRGLSDRDVEAALAETLGPDATVSTSTMSPICERLRDEFAAWNRRRLDDIELDYLFLDGSHFRDHDGADAEPVLAAWGITTAGKPVLVGLTAGTSGSTDAWAEFLGGLRDRGLRCPLLVISDGAAGLIAAVQLHFGQARRQRCGPCPTSSARASSTGASCRSRGQARAAGRRRKPSTRPTGTGTSTRFKRSPTTSGACCGSATRTTARPMTSPRSRDRRSRRTSPRAR